MGRSLDATRVYNISYIFSGSRDSSVGIAAGWTAGVRFPTGAVGFSLLHSVRAGSGASYPVGTGTSLPGCKAAGA
jgi:hypothetical protein